jgi:hypothetical protein
LVIPVVLVILVVEVTFPDLQVVKANLATQVAVELVALGIQAAQALDLQAVKDYSATPVAVARGIRVAQGLDIQVVKVSLVIPVVLVILVVEVTFQDLQVVQAPMGLTAATVLPVTLAAEDFWALLEVKDR